MPLVDVDENGEEIDAHKTVFKGTQYEHEPSVFQTRGIVSLCSIFSSDFEVGYFLFFLIGIGLRITWFAMSAAVGYYAQVSIVIIYFPILIDEIYGPAIFQLFIALYNAPALPVLFAQAKADPMMDSLWGASRAFWFRIIATFIFLGKAQPNWIIFNSSCFGWSSPFSSREQGANFDRCSCRWNFRYGLIEFILCYSILPDHFKAGHGTFTQLASGFPGYSLTFMFSGQAMSAIVLLVITLLSGFAKPEEIRPPLAIPLYFLNCTVWVVIGFISWVPFFFFFGEC